METHGNAKTKTWKTNEKQTVENKMNNHEHTRTKHGINNGYIKKINTHKQQMKNKRPHDETKWPHPRNVYRVFGRCL